MVRCAYITHQLARTSEGGAEAQIRWTEEQVARLRPEYRISRFNTWSDSIDDFDIIHIFAPTNFATESASIAAYAKAHGKAVVTSPIFHPYPGGEGWTGVYARVANKMLTGLRGAFLSRPLSRLNPYIWLYRTLSNSDLVLPNSRQEAEALVRHFAIGSDNIRVVPNGVDLRFARGEPGPFIERYGLKDFILFVGRIEPVKNVASLIEAFERAGLDTDLVIIGSPADPAYCEKCMTMASERVHFLPPMPYNDDLLPSAYAAAKVVALPSRYETVGLVALEGGLAGANVVVTKAGGAREYLEDDAWYVDPGSVSNIADGLKDAYSSPRIPLLRERIARDYSWEEAGKRTVQAYDEALGHVKRAKAQCPGANIVEAAPLYVR